MRILVVSNLYPPHHVGGYELGCQAVVEALRQRGHIVRVLTSDVGGAGTSDDVHRRLPSDWFRPAASKLGHLAYLTAREWSSPRTLRAQIATFWPDVVYVWNPVGLSLSSLAAAESSGVPIHWFVSDSWLERSAEGMERIDAWHALWSHRWRPPISWVQPMFRRCVGAAALAPRRLRLENVQFASSHLRSRAASRGVAPARSRVIHWGVDTNAFSPRTRARTQHRLLYVGQLARHKGTHTAIEALGLLRDSGAFPDLTLDIVGPAVDSVYVNELHRLVDRLALDEVVHFHGSVPRSALPDVYRGADVLIFPSIWDEPFSITLLEGLASGLSVVATSTGGTPEAIDDGETGLLFPAGDAAACADRVARILGDSSLSQKLGIAAATRARDEFTLARMVDRIEAALAARNEPAITTCAEPRASDERFPPPRAPARTDEVRPAPV